MSNPQSITKLCRELRRRSTSAEKTLWKFLRNRNLDNIKFYRQKPLIFEESLGKKYFYIADFFSAQKRLVIELDGEIHKHLKEFDEQRDLVLRGLGLRVLRIKNEELHDIDMVLEKIRKCMGLNE